MIFLPPGIPTIEFSEIKKVLKSFPALCRNLHSIEMRLYYEGGHENFMKLLELLWLVACW